MAERVFDLPDLGEGLEDAEIVEWKVAEGDAVELNQPLVDMNTAKALVEIPSPFEGKVVKLHGAEGDVVKVGEPLVTIDVAGGVAGAEATPEPERKREAVLVGYGVDEATGSGKRRKLKPPGERRAPAAAAAVERAAEVAPDDVGRAYGDEKPKRRVKASPPVRKLAKERGVDLASVEGSGAEGRITRDDVLSAAERGTPFTVMTGEAERVPVRGVRRLIAEKMTRAWTEIPHVTTFHPVDATSVEALRHELSEESGEKVSALAIIVRALVETCRKHQKLNASWQGEEIALYRTYNVGIATDTERGLMVVVMRDADRKGIITIAREIAELVAVAREGRATPEQLTGSTITVTNYGVFGSHYGTPIINHPEAAILGLGTIEPRPFVVDGKVEARPGVVLALSFDHRVLDGADADRAMADLRALLESPFRLGALPRD